MCTHYISGISLDFNGHYMNHSYNIARLIILMLLTFLLINGTHYTSDQSSAETDAFSKGMIALEDGNPEEAIRVWSELLKEESDPDYRLGFYFIKTVTAHNMRDYYEDASVLYYRGLMSDSIGDEEKARLLDDLEFMRPLMDRSEANRIEDLIKERNSAAYREIADFWDSMRITVSDTYNERLLEHWERCHYVSENFKTSRRYAFDDRGEIYLRFGGPDRTRDGTLLYNAGFAEYVLSTRMGDGGGGGSMSSAIDAGSLLNTMYMVRAYHEYPNYEVWVYTDLSESRDNDNVIFIFGNTTGSAVMSQIQTVDDFVPSAAFNVSGRNRPASVAMLNEGNISGDINDDDDSNVAFEGEQGVMGSGEIIAPGLVLQLMYYRQLATVDEYFSSRYDEMMDRYMNTSMPLGKTISRQFQHINTARILSRQGGVPQQRSSQVDRIFTVSSGLYSYRFLDEELNPYLRVYLDADPEEAITYEELRRHNRVDDIAYENFEIVNRIRLFNGAEESIAARIDTLSVQADIISLTDPFSVNMLRIAHDSELTKLESDFELHNRAEYEDRSISEQSTFRNHLKGIGSAATEVPPILESEGFIASDIILGYSIIDESGESTVTVAHNGEIPKNRNLNLYYEAYNLPQNEDGLYSFILDYEIKRDRSWFGRVIRFGGSSGPSITIQNTEERPRFSQMLEIVSEELSDGDYILSLTFKDMDEQTLFSREVEFTIYEP